MMFIYNITMQVEASVHQDWYNWVNTSFIPEMLSTKKFTKAVLSEVLQDENQDSFTYSVQFFVPTETHLEAYKQAYASEIEAKISLFKTRVVSFSSTLKIIDQH